MEVGIVRQVDIDQEMQEAYLDYAMSVIVARALPDVRDGLKPVHRRILYAMHDMGLRPTQPYKKSARIVGEVLGKYHPHGDAAVYDAMARMAQDFSMRAPLVDGQGNFGSIDGDPPAAMRYTEARQTMLSSEMMADLEKNTVDFTENFDGSLLEPTVLPARAPNFLVNGAAGIAVGMATSVPPHNLGEVCDALTFMIDRQKRNRDVTMDDLMKFIQGPDFPTGGIIYRYADDDKNSSDENDLIRSAYAKGRGRITVQARVHVEEMSRNRHRLVITELPYQTNKASLIEKIATLARDGKIDGLTDLRDESDRQGMRLVIEMTRNVNPEAIIKKLFKMTTLRGTFSINMLALVDGEPRLLPIKRSLQLFIEHRQEIITRRSRYELDQAKNRAHILEGLRIALDNLDEVIQTIRKSRSVDTAKKNLRKQFKLSEIQAAAILNMPLRRLAALERKKIETEYKEVQQRIKYLEKLLKTPKKILDVIKEELVELKKTFGTPRRTVIVDKEANGKLITAGDLLPDEEVVVCASKNGQVCRWPADNGLDPARGRQKDPLVAATAAHTHDTLYLFTGGGRAIVVPMHQVPEGKSPGEGAGVHEFSADPVKSIVAGVAIPNSKETPEGYLCLVSRLGRIKRITLEDLVNIRGQEAVVMGVEKGDSLLTAFVTQGKDDVILTSAQGQAIRFVEEDVRPMGLSAAGVWGMKLGTDDALVGGGAVKPRGDLVLVTQQGQGKRISLSEFPQQGRYGQGVIAISLIKAMGPVATADTVNVNDRVMIVTDKGNNKTVYAKSLPKLKRNQRGKDVIAIRGKDKVDRLVILTQ